MATDAIQTENELFSSRVRQFHAFFDADRGEMPYDDQLRIMMERGETRLLINIGELRDYDATLALNVFETPAAWLPSFDKALAEKVADVNPAYGKENKARFSVGFEGNFGTHHVTPKTLNATLVNKLVCIEGIVTKCSLVRPKVLKSVHYCEETKQILQKEYRDATSFGGLPTGSTYLTRDESGNILETEYGLCEYSDSQCILLQEMPENAEVGQLPRSVDVLVADDLADRAKPGDRVQVVGVYRPLAGKVDGSTNGIFRTAIIGVTVRGLSKEVLQSALTDKDIHNIRQVSQLADCFSLLSRSLAPSVCGHEYVKKGLLLLLLGGVEKNLANGTHLRGDVNMLLVGDPSVAKSQLLRYVLHTAPLAVSTTGRGSSGVGLTAAITKDSETGERKLEAGAMVLADRGVVCIDEFDKMSDEDRVAIHEVMEQQTVTIAKAGIHTSLNARCSVVAAANPVYGSYNKQKRPTENIGLPDSLLSRFDLLFILLDSIEESHDRRISEHVLRVHRYRGSSLDECGGLVDNDDQAGGEEDETPVYGKFDRTLHGSNRSAAQATLSQAFVKKYVRYARRTRPRLTEEAGDKIAEIYTAMRSSNNLAGGALPVTPRTLETMIRLATAHAKCRLSSLVELKDVLRAREVLEFAMTNGEIRADEEDEDVAAAASDEDGPDLGGGGGGGGADGGDDDDGSDGEGGGGGEGAGRRTRRGGRRGGKRGPSADQSGRGGGGEEEDEGAGGRSTKRGKGGGKVAAGAMERFKLTVTKYFKEVIRSEDTGVEQVEMSALLAYVSKETGAAYSRAEVDAMMLQMQEDNHIYTSGGSVYLV